MCFAFVGTVKVPLVEKICVLTFKNAPNPGIETAEELAVRAATPATKRLVTELLAKNVFAPAATIATVFAAVAAENLLLKKRF